MYRACLPDAWGSVVGLRGERKKFWGMFRAMVDGAFYGVLSYL